MTAIQGEKRARRDRACTALERLIERFDPTVFDIGRTRARIRVENSGEAHDAVLEDGTARLDRAHGTPDAVLSADAKTWSEIAEDVRSASPGTSGKSCRSPRTSNSTAATCPGSSARARPTRQ